MTLYLEDCKTGIEKLEDNSVDCVVTSPPYNLNIKYNTYSDQKSREEYLSWLNDIFKDLKRVLTDEGNFFLNVGYSNRDPWVAIDVATVARQHFILQNSIVWVKSIYIDDLKLNTGDLKLTDPGKTFGQFKPINGERYLNPTWEHLFHFTKSGDVPLNRKAIGAPFVYKSNQSRFGHEEDKRCKGNVWFVPYKTVSSKKEKGNHPAIFPIKLVEDCLKLTGLEAGLVLDPFIGIGTTAIAALNYGWKTIGFEIDEDYFKFSKSRIEDHLSN